MHIVEAQQSNEDTIIFILQQIYLLFLLYIYTMKLQLELTDTDKPYSTREIMDIYTSLNKKVDDIRKELEQRYIALLIEQKRQSILN